MALLEEILEPVAREIADLLVQSGASGASTWRGYTRNEPLKALKRDRDDQIDFVRSRNGDARLRLTKIRPVDPDPKSIVIHPPIVLESKPRVSASQEINNRTSEEQSFIFKKEFKTGQSEESSVQAGFSVEHTTSIKAGGEASQFEVTEEFKQTVSSEWSRQTGRSKEETTGGEFPLIAAPWTYVRGHLAWDDQKLQRRIECYGTWDFGIEFGRRRRVKRGRNRRWEWSSGKVSWESLEQLLAVAQRRGSVKDDCYEYFAQHRASSKALERIDQKRRSHIDRLTPPFKGAASIRAEYEEHRNVAE